MKSDLPALRRNFVIGEVFMADEFLANNSHETKAAFARALQGLQVTHEPHESKFKPRVPHRSHEADRDALTGNI
jgi:hypothetical protein